jgi:hypothetical protein
MWGVANNPLVPREYEMPAWAKDFLRPTILVAFATIILYRFTLIMTDFGKSCKCWM